MKDERIEDMTLRDAAHQLSKKMAVQTAPLQIGSRMKKDFEEIDSEQTTIGKAALDRAAKQAEQLRSLYPDYFDND